MNKAFGSDIAASRADGLPRNGDRTMANILIARQTHYRPELVSRAMRTVEWLELCQSRWRERRQLAELDDAALKDIGLSRADVAREARRWPWEGPRRLM
ncbi:DUF1127 domain-containing protein [Chelatococcus sp. GCM10030263]|uniref:DUF1127 domain-containing protein n=1 Tax=Chelatococcus sp. GCM10030263 TaxID=3273387 RepID=UPI003609F17B